jgi:hypothetical protein
MQSPDSINQLVNSFAATHLKHENGKDLLSNLIGQLTDIKTSNLNTSDDLISMLTNVNPELVEPVLHNILLKIGLSDTNAKKLEKKFLKERDETLNVTTFLKMAESLQDQKFDQKFVLNLLKSLDLKTILDLLKYKNKELLVIQALLGTKVPDYTKLIHLLTS